MQENVMLIVRDYNHIMNLIEGKERNLFKEHLNELDKNIKQGLGKILWTAGNTDHFVNLCRSSCRDTLRKIKAFQDNYNQIQDEFDKLSTTVLTNVIKRMYKLDEFNEIQENELETKKEFFKTSTNKISKLLIETY